MIYFMRMQKGRWDKDGTEYAKYYALYGQAI
jgi:hypothetical protein